jgi:hypothetical protein
MIVKGDLKRGRKAGLIRSLVVFVGLFFVLSSSHATTVVDVGISALSRNAVEIYRVKVLSSSYQTWNASVWTSHRVQILENIKGDAASGEVVDLHLPGGVDGERTVKISGLPQILPGKEYVVFLRDRVGQSSLNRFADWSAYLVSRNSEEDRFVIAVGANEGRLSNQQQSFHAVKASKIWSYENFLEEIYWNIE